MVTEMEKDTTICFQTTSDIRDAIEEIAEKENRSVSAVVESIVYQHLKENKALKCAVPNRRRSEREKVSFPAFIGDPRWQRRDFIAATIQDISFGGIRVSIPKGTRVKIDNYGKEAEFSVIFSVPDTLWPIHMECRPKWVADSEEAVQLGAALVNTDLTAYKVMQKYLT
ncbi:MAG: PilZ domain-containing protein [Syntrophales bacterium]|nr:PilZ domain-containing protein [Syntrophales bacterium]